MAADASSVVIVGQLAVAGALNGDATFTGDGGLPVAGCTGVGCVFMAMYSAGGTPV